MRAHNIEMLTIGLGGRQVFDSRKLDADDKPSIAVILLGEPSRQE